MGLTTWKNAPGGKMLKTDLSVVKNYLCEKELKNLNRIVTMYLHFAELPAENRFSSKFESKTANELEKIVNSHDEYVEEAKLAAKLELEKREQNRTLQDEVAVEPDLPTGEARYKDFERTIDKSSSFAFTPKYRESFKTNTRLNLIYAIAIKAFERLEWDVVFSDKNKVEAKRRNDFNSWSEKITVSIKPTGDVEVKSSSLGNEMWDMGRNSKRVKLFIHVYQEIELEYDEEKLDGLAAEVTRQENWDDYEIPSTLPKPKYVKEPQLIFPLVLAIVASILLGGLFAVTSKYFYIILLFETGIGIALAFLLLQGVKLGNYTNYTMIRIIMGFSVISIVVLTQYFQYLMIIYEHNAFDLTFFQFIQLRIEAGFMFRDLNTGWVGWLVVIILQLVLIYYTCWLRLIFYITNFQFKRVPEEVVNFAIYHFVKGKSEIEVKNELAMKGWADRQSQEYVMEAVGAVYGQQELRRID